MGIIVYLCSTLIGIGILAIWGLGQNMIFGHTGLPNLGPMAFVSIGAYTTAMSAMILNIPFFVNLMLSSAVGFAVGSVIGWLAIRVKGDYLAILTIGLNFAIWALIMFTRWNGALIFGGTIGLYVPAINIFGMPITSPLHIAILVWILVVFLLIIDYKVINSRLGLGLKAIRNDEIAASSLGVNELKMKIIGFSIGSSFLALGGSIFAYYIGYVNPDYFAFVDSIKIILIPLIGGLATTFGSIIGATIIGIIPEVFRGTPELRYVVYGVLLILIPIFQPMGIFGPDSLLRKSCEKLKRRLKKHLRPLILIGQKRCSE